MTALREPGAAFLLAQLGAHAARRFADRVAELDLTPPQAGCTDSTADDSITVTFTTPDGWTGGIGGMWRIEGTGPPSGAAVMFHRGGWVFDQPCAGGTPKPTIDTGTTVDEFVSVLAEHPDLDVTDPVDVSLAGHDGKYLELRAPANTADTVKAAVL